MVDMTNDVARFEAMFADRFTERDEKFMEIKSKPLPNPIVIYPWKAQRKSWNKRWDYGSRRNLDDRSHGSQRDHHGNRDGNSRSNYRDRSGERRDDRRDRSDHRERSRDRKYDYQSALKAYTEK